jgi:hypothetical protein
VGFCPIGNKKTAEVTVLDKKKSGHDVSGALVKCHNTLFLKI